jgi:hypothetical protein
LPSLIQHPQSSGKRRSAVHGVSTVVVTAFFTSIFGVLPASATESSWKGASHGPAMSAQGLPGAPAATGVNAPITRREVLARARTWAAVPISYSMRRTYQGYRTDCSGYVSMAWHLGSSVVTSSFGPLTHSITKSQLKAGDILNWNNTGPGVGHVVIFEKWADPSSSHRSYWAYEQTPAHTKHRVVPYPYFPGHGRFVPLRYNKIVGDTPFADGHDVNGDGLADVLARDTRGRLFFYRGEGNGKFAPRDRTDTGSWKGHDKILAADVNGDGLADILARDSRGRLLFHRGLGTGAFAPPARPYSSGWKAYNRIVSADVNGDGLADVLSRDSRGRLFLHRGRGDGTFAARVRTDKVSWKGYNKLLAADVTGDGLADVLARDGYGRLFFYRGRGNGTFEGRVRTYAKGWDTYDKLTVGDLTGDGKADVVARDGLGRLFFYRGQGNGRFVKRVRTHTQGWSAYNALL